MPLVLNHVDFGGEGVPLVILHGLFGSSRNWTRVGRSLSKFCHAYALDQRNHGESPHADSHTLNDLSNDLEDWIAQQGIGPVVFLGHSMGGLAAMHCVLRRPELARALIVVDIAPKKYAHHHKQELDALRVDVSRLSTRGQVDDAMALIHPDKMIRQFLQMNLVRQESQPTDGGFSWRLNIEALAGSRFMEEGGFQDSYHGPVLLVSGGESPYVDLVDHAAIRLLFPQARIETIPGADHYLHYTHQEELLTMVRNFLQGLVPAAR